MSEETVSKIIKSCIVSRKGGVPLDEIENDYKDLVGQTIPYLELGYRSLKDFVTSIEYIEAKVNFFGDVILHVSDPKVAHIESLVSKQKNPSDRFANFKKSKQTRYQKTRWMNNDHNNNSNNNVVRDLNYCPSYRRYADNNDRVLSKFNKNKKMEYSQSKWYSDRAKDSWTKKKNENRKMNRYNNFNAGRPVIQNYNNNSTIQNDNSWSAKSVSATSTEEHYPNMQYGDERRYAPESRSWRFQVQMADDVNSNSTGVSLEPLINGKQLIGDDFFLQLALQDLKADSHKPRVNAGIQCGLCISGQTIDECRQRLEQTNFLSSNVAILLGAVDIFQGHSLEKMVKDMKKLLDVCKNRFNVSNVTLCTIPPLANYSVRFNLPKLSVLYSFNNWIKLHNNVDLDDSYVHHYDVIDLFRKFTDSNHRTLYSYFQIDARMVSGCPYPHVLWNRMGRHKVIRMLSN